MSTNAWSQSVLLEQTFSGTTANDWIFVAGNGSQLPSLTADTGIDDPGEGWLRLTNDLSNQSTFSYYNIPISSENGMVFNFDFAIWTTEARNAGDGFTLSIFAPPAENETVEAGGYGGSLGYAQRFNDPGLSNALLGVGFDPFGNFSEGREGRVGGPGRRPDSIAIRGPMGEDRQSGYEYIQGTGSLDPFFTRDAEDRSEVTTHSARIEVSPDRTLSVSWTDANGVWEKLVLEDCDLPCPEEVMFGFTAGTGNARSNQEIQNLIVTESGASGNIWNGQSASTSSWGDEDNWVDGLPAFDGQTDLVFTAEGAHRLENYLGADRSIRSLEFNGATPGDITLRTTASADGNDGVNLNFLADGDGSSIFVREAMTGDITIGGDGGGSLTFNTNMLISNSGSGILTIDQPIQGAVGFTNSGSGTLVLAAENTFTGNITLMDGTVRTEGDGTLGAPGRDVIAYGGTLDLGGTTQSVNNIEQRGGEVTNGTLNISGRFQYHAGEFDNNTVLLTGTGGLDLQENRTLRLDNANTYEGTTIVRRGVLDVSNQTGSGTGTGTVGIDADLIGNHDGGTGNIAGDTTINGTHAVGDGSDDSIGLHRFGGNLTYTEGSVFQWTVTDGETYDRVEVGGDLTIEDGAILEIVSTTEFSDPFWEQDQEWSHIFDGKTISGFKPEHFVFRHLENTFTATELATYGTFSISGSDLVWTAIPEPGTALVGILLAAGLMRRRR